MNSKLNIYAAFFNLPAPVRRLGAWLTYELFSRLQAEKLRRRGDPPTGPTAVASTFMNYGYTDEALEANPPEPIRGQRENRYPVQLYHHVTEPLALAGKDVLEVGSGRGGGCLYIADQLDPRSVVGLERSQAAVEFSRIACVNPRLTFREGDAEALPFPDASFDAVINVESSHCYGSMDRFLGEVARVLRPGGLFSWVDARPSEGVAALERSFAASGLEQVRALDITPNVVLALQRSSAMKLEMLAADVARPLRPIMASVLGTRGSVPFEALRGGRVVYLSRVYRKPDSAPVNPEPPAPHEGSEPHEPEEATEAEEPPEPPEPAAPASRRRRGTRS